MYHQNENKGNGESYPRHHALIGHGCEQQSGILGERDIRVDVVAHDTQLRYRACSMGIALVIEERKHINHGEFDRPTCSLPKPIFEITEHIQLRGRSLPASFVYSRTDDVG